MSNIKFFRRLIGGEWFKMQDGNWYRSDEILFAWNAPPIQHEVYSDGVCVRKILTIQEGLTIKNNHL